MLYFQPPVTFQPPPPPGGSNANNNNVQTVKAAERPAQPDLITRYNLKDKVNAPVTQEESSRTPPGGNGKAWSSNKDERQSLLQKRRDQMILEARRKMEAKIAAEKAAGAS